MSNEDEIQRLRVLLKAYMQRFPAFRTKPVGAPHSKMRNDQTTHIALEDLARAALSVEVKDV